MHRFSRNDAPMGERPVEMVAVSPGRSTTGSMALMTPERGISVPCGIVALCPVTLETSFQPSMRTLSFAREERRMDTDSFFAVVAFGPELYRSNVTRPR